MAEKDRGSIVVLTVPIGRFIWWRGLDIIDFVPKGRRVATGTITLRRTDCNFAGALKTAAIEVSKHSAYYGGL